MKACYKCGKPCEPQPGTPSFVWSNLDYPENWIFDYETRLANIHNKNSTYRRFQQYCNLTVPVGMVSKEEAEKIYKEWKEKNP